MAKTTDKVYDAADNVKPYVQRALHDEKLREDVLSAFSTAKELYTELVGGRGAVTLAQRVATDDEVRDKLRDAIDDLPAQPTACRGGRARARVTPACSSQGSRSASSSTRSPARRRGGG
jgi:hypothetical protein